MNKLISTLCAIALMLSFCTACTNANADTIDLSQVNETNYMEYEKPIKDAYGYNKGECEREYLPHEEYFYGESYDHWNIDKVYDADVIEDVFGTEDDDSDVTETKTETDKMTNKKAKKIIAEEKDLCDITYFKLIDEYLEGGWYCYYLYNAGDVYVATIKRGHVQEFVRLN